MKSNVLLLDIGNTHTHVGVARDARIWPCPNLSTADWMTGAAGEKLRLNVNPGTLNGIAVCSVVPKATPHVRRLGQAWGLAVLELNASTVTGVGIAYPKPETIGADRLANAVAAKAHFGTPVVVIDFGTAVTFDVVDRRGRYIGGIIAPGLSVMTDYLHEKTALLPRIKIRDTRAIVGKNTDEAMLIGAVHGYRGLIRELLRELRRHLQCRRLTVIATGGYAELMARKLPEIQTVDPLLTLEGLHLVWRTRSGPGSDVGNGPRVGRAPSKTRSGLARVSRKRSSRFGEVARTVPPKPRS